MARVKPNALPWLGVSLLVFVLDQWSKAWVLSSLPEYTAVPVIDGFWNWYRTYNTGAAFSFLADHDGWQRWLFAAIAVGVSAVLVVWLKRLPRRGQGWLALGLALVLGGALGNLFDRVVYGHVIDFILVHWQNRWYFPAFNIADCAISVGAVLLAVDMFKSEKSGDRND